MGEYATRMENEMSIRGFSEETKKTYLICMRSFVKYYRRPPDKLTLDDINRYQIYLAKEKKVATSTFNQQICAISFFYKYVLKKPWLITNIPHQKTEKRLPTVLSKEEILKLLEAPGNPKHRALLSTLYSTGLRVGELSRLKPADIESARMMIRVNQGKGRKDRYVMLSPRLLDILRSYWKAYWSGAHLKPAYLFPGETPAVPLKRKSIYSVVKNAAKKAGIAAKKVSPHVLRHSFSTHLLEDGVNIRVIQSLLGHRSLRTTAVYTNVASNYLAVTPSPLDTLPGIVTAIAGGN